MIWDRMPYRWPEGRSAAACFTVDADATAPWLWQHRGGVPDTLAALEHRRYGMRAGLARMVAMLDRLGVAGSFFVPGVVAEENPELLPGLLNRGHEIALHGYYHEIVSETSEQRFDDALGASLDLFVAQTGHRPAGFRSPAWEMTPHMLAGVKAAGLWDSSLMGHDLPYRIAGVTEVPVRWDNDDAIFLKFLGAGDRPSTPDRELGDRWADEAGAQVRDGGMFVLTVHDWLSGRAGRVEMLERVLRPLAEDPSVWVAPCGAIAAHHDTLSGGLDVALDRVEPVDGRGTAA